jgi:hypothetical protein
MLIFVELERRLCKNVTRFSHDQFFIGKLISAVIYAAEVEACQTDVTAGIKCRFL